MKTSICQYSVHRVFEQEKWSIEQFVAYVKEQGVDGLDFHARYLPSPDVAAERIQSAMAGSGLALSGLSLSTNFNQEEPEKLRKQIDSAKEWLRVASAVKAPVSRVFGGGFRQRGDAEAYRAASDRVVSALKELVVCARENGVVLALENHGGLPCSGEEQAEIITAVNDPFLKATIDLGNYMQYPQASEAGTAAAVEHCAYVHFKDFRRLPDGKLQGTVIGEGDVDLKACLSVLKKAGYDGFLALEYEGEEDERTGIPKSFAYLSQALAEC